MILKFIPFIINLNLMSENKKTLLSRTVRFFKIQLQRIECIIKNS